jgi:RNA ligase (TIGR02306 family)
MRQLVTIREVLKISPIPGADAIELAQIDGWQVVTRKGEFTQGDSCVYFEIDSFLPASDPRFGFLTERSSRVFQGVKGHPVKTVSLRGQLSQGIALPCSLFPELVDGDDDMAGKLGVLKWEPQPTSAVISGLAKGLFPSYIQKTDQERCQNLGELIFGSQINARYEVTTKLDGTSVTYYQNNSQIGVCSRNLELKLEGNEGNAIIRTFREGGLDRILPQLGNVAIQGELMGPGIQKNREGLSKATYFLFDVQDLDSGRYLNPGERSDLYAQMCYLGVNLEVIRQVPILKDGVSLKDLGITDMTTLLDFANGPSLYHPVREGVVFKSYSGRFSFKVISNKFLIRD